MLATKDAPRDPFQFLERRHNLAEIVERGVGVPVEHPRVKFPRCPDAARDCVWSGEGIMQPYASTLLEQPSIPQGHDIASVVARCVMEDSGLRPAARAGTLTPELLRPVVIRRMNNGEFGDRYVKLRYKPHIMKTRWSSDVESGPAARHR